MRAFRSFHAAWSGGPGDLLKDPSSQPQTRKSYAQSISLPPISNCAGVTPAVGCCNNRAVLRVLMRITEPQSFPGTFAFFLYHVGNVAARTKGISCRPLRPHELA